MRCIPLAPHAAGDLNTPCASTRMAGLGARRAPRDTGRQPRPFAFVSPWLLALLVVALFSGNARAQVPTGTISGRVTSSDGLPLPGVTVTATADILQGARTIVTTANGDFILRSCRPAITPSSSN
jgi:hypothetical protein